MEKKKKKKRKKKEKETETQKVLAVCTGHVNSNCEVLISKVARKASKVGN